MFFRVPPVCSLGLGTLCTSQFSCCWNNPSACLPWAKAGWSGVGLQRHISDLCFRLLDPMIISQYKDHDSGCQTVCASLYQLLPQSWRCLLTRGLQLMWWQLVLLVSKAWFSLKTLVSVCKWCHWYGWSRKKCLCRFPKKTQRGNGESTTLE